MTTGRSNGNMRHLLHGRGLVLVGAILLGTNGTAQAFAPPGTSPPVLGAVRLGISACVLLAWAYFRGHLRPGHGGRWPVGPTLAVAGFMAIFQVTFFSAVALTGVAVGTIVTLGSCPIIAGVLGFIVRGEQPTLRWAAMTLVAILGCGLLVVDGDVATNAWGIALALAAGTAAAGYVLMSKALLDEHAPEAVAAVTFTIGALLLAPVLALGDLSWLADPRGVAVALHVGVIASAIAFLAYMHGLRRVSVATTVTLTLVEPLTATLLGVLVLGERLAFEGLLGVILVTASLMGLTAGPKAIDQPGDAPRDALGRAPGERGRPWGDEFPGGSGPAMRHE